MKKYREKINANTFWVYTVHGPLVHDIIKGWGTVSPSGKTVVWESWSKPKKLANNRRKDFSTFCMPVLDKVFPTLSVADIVSVQPMTAKWNIDWVDIRKS